MTDRKLRRDGPRMVPEGLGRAGTALYSDVSGRFELAGHELELLAQAARTADLCEVLEALVAHEGPVVRTASGTPRVNPVVVELRQQRVTLSRIVAALRVPDDPDAGERKQRRSARGAYAGRQ